MSEIDQLWDEIIQWCKEHAPPCYDEITGAEGATEAEIAALEEAVGLRLPEDYRQFLARFSEYLGVPFWEYGSLNVENIHKWREILNDLKSQARFEKAEQTMEPSDPNIRHTFWHPGWLPFAEDGGGNLICIDLDPTEQGAVGQVFFWEKDCGACCREAPSFTEYVRAYRDELLSGKYKYDEDTETFEKE